MEPHYAVLLTIEQEGQRRVLVVPYRTLKSATGQILTGRARALHSEASYMAAAGSPLNPDKPERGTIIEAVAVQLVPITGGR